jgi:hypothetical protein
MLMTLGIVFNAALHCTLSGKPSQIALKMSVAVDAEAEILTGEWNMSALAFQEAARS